MKEHLSISLKNVEGFIPSEEVIALAQLASRHLDTLAAGTGAGSDFLGWITLPSDIESQLKRIEKKADELRSVSDTTVVIGIGGSYLGAKAVIEGLSHTFAASMKKKQHEIFLS